MSLSAKLIAAFGLSVSVTLFLVVGAIWASKSYEEALFRLDKAELQSRTLEQLATKLQKRHTALTRLVYAGHEDARREAVLTGAAARALVSNLIEVENAEHYAMTDSPSSEGDNHTESDQLRRLIGFRDELDRVDAAWWNYVAKVGTIVPEQARNLFDEGCDKPLKQELLPRIEAMLQAERLNVEEQRQAVMHLAESVRHGAWMAAISAVVVAGSAVMLLRRSVAAVNRVKDAEASANRTKSLFLANMSHEIRTPLNGILGFTHLLQRQTGPITDLETQQFIATIQSSGKHLLALINDILDLSKVEAGCMQCEIAEHRLIPLYEEVIAVLRARADAKSISLTLYWVGRLPAVIRTDANRLKQVLLNLIGNAVKFTKEGCVRVEIRAVPRGSEWDLVTDITDTGTGIPADQLQTIFQPFRQVDSSYTRSNEGTGLGLSICQRLAELLGGSISVVSVQSRGSTFTLTLNHVGFEGVEMFDPAEVHRVAELRPQPLSATVSLNGATVLIADDMKTNRDLIRVLLTRAGATVLHAENGEIAVEIALSNAVDLVLMDIQMPIMDGLMATRRLHDCGFNRPIVALTANAMESDRLACFEAGCSGYISKPVEPADLMAEIGRQLANARSTERHSVRPSVPFATK